MRSSDEPHAQPGDSEIAGLVLAVLTPLTRHLGRRLRERSAISVDQFKALHALEAGPLRSSELASRILLSPAAVTRLADGLVADHLVVRAADATDRRAVRLVLTQVGRAELERGAQVVTEALEQMLGRLEPDERRRLVLAFEDLQGILEAEPACGPSRPAAADRTT